MKMKKRKKDSFLKENLNLFLFVSVFFIWPLSHFFIALPIVDYYLEKKGTRTRGVMTSISSNLQYVTSTDNGFNVYEFDYEGKRYKGISEIPFTLDVVGDSIDIVFFEFWPDFNRPKSFFTKKKANEN